jgi:hypothetical protein
MGQLGAQRAGKMMLDVARVNPPAGLLRAASLTGRPVPTTTSSAAAAPATTPHCASCPTGWSASCTATSNQNPLRRTHRLAHHTTKINKLPLDN